jgi:hypothetical protein
VATEAIIADIEQYESLEKRLEVLLRRAFGQSAALEIRMRAWADNNQRRRGYIEQLLLEAKIASPLAATPTQVLYWAYLGAALSRSKLAGERLDRIVAELKQIGLGLPTTFAGAEFALRIGNSYRP